MDHEEIKRESRLKWFYLVLTALVGVGILTLNWHLDLGGIVKEIGIAILAAAILGATIDLWLKKQIVRDVFAAAFGYGQDPDVVNELRALSQIKIVITSYSLDLQLLPIDGQPHELLARVNIRSTFTNKGNRSEIVPLRLSIDEWFASQPGKLTRYSLYTSTGKRYDGPLKIEKTECGQRIIEIPPVTLPDNGTCDVEAQFEEVKRRNDSMIGVMRICSKNPRISISPCDGIQATVSFINRGKDQQSERVKNVWVLHGVLLPFQAFQMRWWDEAQSAQWRAAAGAHD
jgi:hypothetical protein